MRYHTRLKGGKTASLQEWMSLDGLCANFPISIQLWSWFVFIPLKHSTFPPRQDQRRAAYCSSTEHRARKRGRWVWWSRRVFGKAEPPHCQQSQTTPEEATLHARHPRKRQTQTHTHTHTHHCTSRHPRKRQTQAHTHRHTTVPHG